MKLKPVRVSSRIEVVDASLNRAVIGVKVNALDSQDRFSFPTINVGGHTPRSGHSGDDLFGSHNRQAQNLV